MRKKKNAMSTNTKFETRCQILSDLWIQYGDEPELSDFVSYNDLGLALAFAISEDIVKTTTVAESYINESFDLLLESMKLEDTGFEGLDEVFSKGWELGRKPLLLIRLGDFKKKDYEPTKNFPGLRSKALRSQTLYPQTSHLSNPHSVV